MARFHFTIPGGDSRRTDGIRACLDMLEKHAPEDGTLTRCGLSRAAVLRMTAGLRTMPAAMPAPRKRIPRDMAAYERFVVIARERRQRAHDVANDRIHAEQAAADASVRAIAEATGVSQATAVNWLARAEAHNLLPPRPAYAQVHRVTSAEERTEEAERLAKVITERRGKYQRANLTNRGKRAQEALFLACADAAKLAPTVAHKRYEDARQLGLISDEIHALADEVTRVARSYQTQLSKRARRNCVAL
jgi:hypothetical protein